MSDEREYVDEEIVESVENPVEASENEVSVEEVTSDDSSAEPRITDAMPAITNSIESESDDPYVNFTAHHLHLLHSALQTSNLGVSSRILNEIKDQYDIDISDESVLSTLSAAQYASLKKYEKKNTDFLVAAIVNEYPGAIKYLSKIVNRGNVIDPLGSFQKWFGALVFCVGALYLFSASYWPIPESNKDIVSIVIGVIIGQLIMTPMNYIFRQRQDSPSNTTFPVMTNFKKK